MNISVCLSVLLLLGVFCGTAEAGPMVKAEDACADPSLDGAMLPATVKDLQSYIVEVSFLNHQNQVIASWPLMTVGHGVSRWNDGRRQDFAVTIPGGLKAVPVCTGLAAAVEIEPVSEKAGVVHLAIAVSSLSEAQLALARQAWAAPPGPAQQTIEKALTMQSGEAQTIDIAGDRDIAKVKLSFATYKP